MCMLAKVALPAQVLAAAAAAIAVPEALNAAATPATPAMGTAMGTAVEFAMSRKNILITILVVLVLAVLGLLLYQHSGSSGSSNTATSTVLSVATVNSQIEQSIPAFAAAVRSEAKSDYSSAIPQLQSALASTQNAQQQITIQFHLIQDYELTGDNTDAVALLQKIASTASYPAATRALAVENIASLYANNPGANLAPLIFAQAPYSALYVATSTNLSTRNLFQYATSIEPLPVSEYSIANTYVDAITDLGLENMTSTAGKARFASFEQNAEQSFEAGETTLVLVEKNPPTLYYVLDAQLERAVVLGKLQLIGNTSLGSADQAFQALLSSYSSQNLTIDGFVRIQYAEFLANAYGAARATDIDTVLAPIYQDPTHRGAAVELYLKQYIGAPSSPAKADLALVASIDAQFKSFLSSLGWTIADFSATTKATQ